MLYFFFLRLTQYSMFDAFKLFFLNKNKILNKENSYHKISFNHKMTVVNAIYV